MTTYNIVSRHAKLSDAVAAAGIDLSYNEPLARADLAGNDRDNHITEAFVLERDGEVTVWFLYHADIKILNRYSPFSACLRNGNFSTVQIGEATVEIGSPIIRRGARKQIAEFGLIVALP
jgi:hypothetical protein